MYRGVPDGSGSKRRTQFIALVAFVIVALATTALVTWLVVATGLQFWAFVFLLGTVVSVAVVIGD